MNEVRVTELGYLGIPVSNVNAWKEYAAEVVGMEVVDEGEKDRFYLRMDHWHHRFVVQACDRDDLEYLDFRVAGPDELEQMAQKFEKVGYAFRFANEDETKERHVLGLLKLADPGGNPVEIF